jgi:hypothetical protein
MAKKFKNKEEERDYYVNRSKRDWEIANAARKLSTFTLAAAVVINLIGLGFAGLCDRNINRAKKVNNK